VEIPKQLREAICIETPERWPMIGFSTMTMVQLTRCTIKKFLIKKLITEMEHSLYSLDLAPNNFWLFPKIKSALKGQRFQDTEDIQKDVMMALKAIPQQEL